MLTIIIIISEGAGGKGGFASLPQATLHPRVVKKCKTNRAIHFNTPTPQDANSRSGSIKYVLVFRKCLMMNTKNGLHRFWNDGVLWWSDRRGMGSTTLPFCVSPSSVCWPERFQYYQCSKSHRQFVSHQHVARLISKQGSFSAFAHNRDFLLLIPYKTYHRSD